MANIPVFDYRKTTKEQIHAFMVANATPAEKKAFMESAFEEKKQTISIPDCYEGTNKQKMVRRKQKDGSYKVIPKMKYVELTDGEVKTVYNHQRAIAWFVDTYEGQGKIEVVNKPKKAKADEEKKISAKELFADF